MIDPLSPVPSYVQVADAIAADITAGRIRTLMPIPSEAHLQQRYGVSRGTVRHAVAVLRERGLVITVQGRGTYVSEPVDAEDPEG